MAGPMISSAPNGSGTPSFHRQLNRESQFSLMVTVSHVADALRELALAHNIHFFCLPPYTTQPLDVDVLGPLQIGWAARCDEINIIEDTEEEMPR
jgi:hypothetical protein